MKWFHSVILLIVYILSMSMAFKVGWLQGRWNTIKALQELAERNSKKPGIIPSDIFTTPVMP